MTLRDFGFYINDSITVVVVNLEDRLIALSDGKESIPEQFLDRDLVGIERATFNTIWVKIN